MKNNLLYNTEMKKLYYLDESEKERILNLHQVQKIKRIWMNEQTTQSNLPKGTLTDSEKQQFRTSLNYFESRVDKKNGRKILYDNCLKIANVNRLTLSHTEIENIVTPVFVALRKGEENTPLYGDRGVNKDTPPVFKQGILALKNIPNFCYAVTNITNTIDVGNWETQNNRNFLWVIDEIRIPERNKEYVIQPISSLIDYKPEGSSPNSKVKPEKWPQEYACVVNTAGITYDATYNMYKGSSYYYYSDGTLGSIEDPDKEIGNFRCGKSGKVIVDLNVDEDKVKEAGFDKFPCVTSNPDKTVSYTSSKQIVFVIGDYIYYGSGRRYNQKTSQMSDYHCGNDNSIKDGPKPTTSTETNTTTTPGLTGPWGKALGTAPKLLNTSTINQTVINNMSKNLGIV